MITFKFITNEGLKADDKNIVDFDVKVIRIFHYIEDDEQKKSSIEYELVARTLDGTELPPRRVKRLNNLSYFTLWTEIMDAGLSKWERRMLLLRLQTSCKEAEQIKVYHVTSNGFRVLENNRFMFVAGDFIYPSNIEGIMLNLDERIRQMKWKNEALSLRNKCMVEKEKDYLMVSPKSGEIIFTAVLLSAIKFLFVKAGFNPAVCINLYGKTGSYKTALTQAMMYMENPSYFMCSLVNDQKKMAVKKVQECYGFPVVLEDYHPATGYDYKRQISMMDAVVRHIEANPQSAVVFITSEFLDGVESLQARTLQIEAQKVNLPILTKIQNEQNIVVIVRNFLMKLLEHIEEAVSIIQKQYQDLDQHGKKGMRIEESIIFLKITAILYEKFMDKEGKLNLSSKLDTALEFQKEKQRRHLEQLSIPEEDKVVMFIKTLMEDKELYREYNYEKRALYTGKKDERYVNNNCVYFSRDALVYGLNKYGFAGLTLKKVVSTLAKLNFLNEDGGGTHTTKVQSFRVYGILMIRFKEYYDSIVDTAA